MDIKIKKKLVKNWFKILQDIICNDIEELEGKKNIFKSKVWFRDKNKKEGGGEFRILTNGKIFEKVGVNFSEVYGKFSKKFRNQIPGTNKSPNFWASGISIVMHMKNPHIPAIQRAWMKIRLFQGLSHHQPEYLGHPSMHRLVPQP